MKDEQFLSTKNAAKLAGFKYKESFAVWAKSNGFYPEKEEVQKMGGRPIHLWKKSDVLKIADLRNPEKQKDDDTITGDDAVKILGYKNIETLRQLSNKNPGFIEKKVILEGGRRRNYYSKKNIIEVLDLLKKRVMNFKKPTDDDDEIYEPGKQYQDGFEIKSTPLLDIKLTQLTVKFYKNLHNMRQQQ